MNTHNKENDVKTKKPKPARKDTKPKQGAKRRPIKAVGRTEIVVILDRSGSMQTAKSDHEGGLKTFVDEQRKLPGDAKFTLVKFDSQNPCEIAYDGVALADVGKIVLDPRGNTPLLDAIGLATSHVEARVKDDNVAQVIVLVVTDGQENCSREWTKERIRARVSDLEDKGWKFVFLGANIDSFSEAGAIGIARGSSMDYANNSKGVAASYAAMHTNTSRSRMLSAQGATGAVLCSAMNFTDQQRQAAKPDNQ